MARRTWGFSDDEWSNARRTLARLLAEVASRRSTITYGEIARRIFDGRVSARSGAVIDLLGEVDAATEASRGVMLAALVVRADTGMPGEGFFAFAEHGLGREAVGDRRLFWEREAERVWEAYEPPPAPASCAGAGARSGEVVGVRSAVTAGGRRSVRGGDR